MAEEKESIWEETWKGVKIKYIGGALAFIAGSALTITAIAIGVREGFKGNYLKLFAGVFLMAFFIEQIIRWWIRSSRDFDKKRALEKEAERVFDTPEKKLTAPKTKKKTDLSWLIGFLLVAPIFLALLSIATLFAALILNVEYLTDYYAETIAGYGYIGLLSSVVLFILGLVLAANQY